MAKEKVSKTLKYMDYTNQAPAGFDQRGLLPDTVEDNARPMVWSSNNQKGAGPFDSYPNIGTAKELNKEWFDGGDIVDQNQANDNQDFE